MSNPQLRLDSTDGPSSPVFLMPPNAAFFPETRRDDAVSVHDGALIDWGSGFCHVSIFCLVVVLFLF